MEEFDFQELRRLFEVVVRVTNYSIYESRCIKARVGILCGYHFGASWEAEHRYEKYKLLQQTQDFVIEELYHQCMMRKHYQKYDSTKAQLITWVMYFVHHYVRNLLKRYKPRNFNEKNRSRLDVYDGKNKNYRVSETECEEWFLMPASLGTPEEYLIAKQLLSITREHFSEQDMLVISGNSSIRDVVVANNMNYDQYYKQLQRRRESFRAVISTHGYEY
ncbi:hypothetical protein [Desulfopila sp. IMCC35008]|uniref:hypothetical protein n=1 Tax=Desulfopila sp. IMCC35008 TaxID=2653858 RepID=UPI0013D1AD3A|nr:hypothetical protein [Desulfopila sp. IMCC35008]